MSTIKPAHMLLKAWELVAPVASSQTPPCLSLPGPGSCFMWSNNGWQSAGHGLQQYRNKWHVILCQTIRKEDRRKNETASCCDWAQSNNAGRPSLFFVLLILTSVLLLCQTRENDARRRKALLLFVWDDVWPLSLATSPAPRTTHPLGPNVDKDRKTTTVKQNVKPWMLLLGLFLFYFVIFLHSSE